MRILVIEDEDTLRAQLVERLRREGYAVDETGSGREGEFFGLEYPIDVAVVDLGLPKLPGLEVIRRWRDFPDMTDPGPEPIEWPADHPLPPE